MATVGITPAVGPGRPPSVVEQELVNSLDWLVSLRWLAGGLVLVATFLAAAVLHVPVPARGLVTTALAIFAYNALLRWSLHLLRRAAPEATGRFEAFGRVQIGLDWLAMAAIIAQSGGAESPAIVFFLFHITIASLLLSHHLEFVWVSLAPLLVAGVAALEYTGVLPHVAVIQPARFRDPVFVLASVGFFTVACYSMAYCCMAIASRLRRREQELGGLYASVRGITSSLELDAVLDHIVEAAANVLGCRAAAIRLVDLTRSQVEFAASWGLSETYQDQVPEEYARSMLDRDTLREGVVHVPDIFRDPRMARPDLARAEGITSMLSVPLLGRTGPLGVLRAYGDAGHRFTPGDADYLRAVAAHGAVAIENAKAYRVLARLDEDKSRFLGLTTHELRSPVRATETLLATLSESVEGELRADLAELLRRARRRLASLHELIDDLLDLAAGKAAMRVPQYRMLDAVALVRDVVERHRPLAGEKGLTLDFEAPGQGVDLWCDPADLERMTANLVGNAVKYTYRGGVSVRLYRDGDRVCLTVRDTGIGIPEEAQARLFEEFYRAGNAKAAGETGTGLGLAIVKQLAERHGGEVTVSSHEGGGSVFTITLPRAGPGPGGSDTE